MKRSFVWLFFLLLSTVIYAQRPVGNYLQLDGDGDFMQLVYYADSLIFDGPATIEFWARPDYDHRSNVGVLWEINDDNPLLTSGTEYFEFTYGNHTSQLSNERINIVYSQGNQTFSNYYYLADDANHRGEWQHFAMVADGAEYLLYINGQLQSVQANPAMGNSQPKLYGAGITPKINAVLGSRYLDSTSTYSFKGGIDEFRIWSIARSIEQIQSTMNDTLQAAYYVSRDSGLVACWRFDEEEDLAIGNETTTDIRDFSGNGYHGDLAGDARVVYEPFTQMPLGTTTSSNLTGSWGDYDNDGDLDILVSGGLGFFKIYRNENGIFSDIESARTGIAGFSDWGDYDNDNDLDILISSGFTDMTSFLMNVSVYVNLAGTFAELEPGIETYLFLSTSWQDTDNDGDQDIVIANHPDTIKVYHNNQDIYADPGGPEGHSSATISWSDYDGDGDADFFLAGNQFNAAGALMRNDSGLFSNSDLPFPQVLGGSSSWVDYDNDGDADLFLTGGDSMAFSRIYRNDDNTFTDISAGLPGFFYSSGIWGDYDNDGDSDLLLTGNSGSGNIAQLFLNENGIFTDSKIPLPGLRNPHSAWADFDKDGDLDILFVGDSTMAIYRNDMEVTKNSPPSAPTGLTAEYADSIIIFSWLAATDAQTAAAGLSYNLRVGSAPGGTDIVSPQAAADGFRKVAETGNVFQNLTWMIHNLPAEQTFYWSVQAVDNSFTGGPWAEEQMIYTGGLSALKEAGPALYKFSLSPNYPNPFNPRTVISYQLPSSGFVELTVYDAAGRKVRTLLSREMIAGSYSVTFDGAELASGLYYARLTTSSHLQRTIKMLLIR